MEVRGCFASPWNERRKKRKGIPEEERARGLREQMPLEGVLPEEPFKDRKSAGGEGWFRDLVLT